MYLVVTEFQTKLYSVVIRKGTMTLKMTIFKLSLFRVDYSSEKFSK